MLYSAIKQFNKASRGHRQHVIVRIISYGQGERDDVCNYVGAIFYNNAGTKIVYLLSYVSSFLLKSKIFSDDVNDVSILQSSNKNKVNATLHFFFILLHKNLTHCVTVQCNGDQNCSINSLEDFIELLTCLNAHPRQNDVAVSYVFLPLPLF